MLVFTTKPQCLFLPFITNVIWAFKDTSIISKPDIIHPCHRNGYAYVPNVWPTPYQYCVI